MTAINTLFLVDGFENNWVKLTFSTVASASRAKNISLASPEASLALNFCRISYPFSYPNFFITKRGDSGIKKTPTRGSAAAMAGIIRIT
eukprot:Awhi_evm2s11246